MSERVHIIAPWGGEISVPLDRVAELYPGAQILHYENGGPVTLPEPESKPEKNRRSAAPAAAEPVAVEPTGADA